MSTYEFQTAPATARTAAEIPEAIRGVLASLAVNGNDDDVAEIHALLSGQHGGYDIEVIYAVEDED